MGVAGEKEGTQAAAGGAVAGYPFPTLYSPALPQRLHVPSDSHIILKDVFPRKGKHLDHGTAVGHAVFTP